MCSDLHFASACSVLAGKACKKSIGILKDQIPLWDQSPYFNALTAGAPWWGGVRTTCV